MEKSPTKEAFYYFILLFFFFFTCPLPTDLFLSLSRTPQAAGSRRAPGVICGCLAVNLLY